MAIVTIALSFAVPALTASESPERAFVRSWEGRTVVARYPLHSLVYNERGRLGQTYNNRRDGLTVVTPSEGFYFQFDGRQGRDDVTGRDPQSVFNEVATAYDADSLELRSYRKVEPLLITRYDAGVEFIVTNVRINRDTVRLIFAKTMARDEPVTWLTIKWPVPLSKSLSERDLIEDLIRRFVDVKPAGD